MNHQRIVASALNIAIALAWFVVVLGAYTRLTEAGLGCPDWPVCYGHWKVPRYLSGLQITRAWMEMLHRYVAGVLGLIIMFIASATSKRAGFLPMTWLLLGLLLLQVLLGMWTVTLKLWPVVVVAHLCNGLAILSVLWGVRLRWKGQYVSLFSETADHLTPWLKIALGIVVIQIFLGAWVSTHYAGLSCVGFPRCHGYWLPPHLNFHDMLRIGPSGKVNYQGGILDYPTRVTIQWVHRVGALLTLLYVFILSSVILIKMPTLRFNASMVMVLLMSQFALGVVNVTYFLPLPVAVAHNGVAALLLLSLLSLHYYASKRHDMADFLFYGVDDRHKV